MTGRLKPCPFCGGEGRIWRQAGTRSVVGCAASSFSCPITPHVYDLHEDAVAAWDRRVPALSPAPAEQEETP